MMVELWPGSGDRPTNMADRLASMVRHMPPGAWKQISVDPLDSQQLARLLVFLDELSPRAGKRLWNRFHEATPRCVGCGGRHWPEDPHEPNKQKTPPP